MHRKDLLNKLAEYELSDDHDRQSRRRIEAFVREHPDCFERSLTVGHVTGSAWLVDQSGQRVLLTHHKKLGRWLQLGGHADGCSDVLEVALREAREESGIETIRPISERIFDLDVHWIPERHDEPGHYHHDVRFLLKVDGEEEFRVSDESHALRWFGVDEFSILETDESVMRMHGKWLGRL